jgi:hypothetical protein
MVIRKIWCDSERRERHDSKYVEMRGWFLFGFIPLYIVEVRTID